MTKSHYRYWPLGKGGALIPMRAATPLTKGNEPVYMAEFDAMARRLGVETVAERQAVNQ